MEKKHIDLSAAVRWRSSLSVLLAGDWWLLMHKKERLSVKTCIFSEKCRNVIEILH